MTAFADCFEQRGNARGVEGEVWPDVIGSSTGVAAESELD